MLRRYSPFPPSSRPSGQDLDAARPAALASLNRELDRRVAALGIHPGRQGLRDAEFLAAMKLLE